MTWEIDETYTIDTDWSDWLGLPPIQECIMYWNDSLAYCYYCHIQYLEYLT
jgi:hypothetical protein